MFVIVINKVHKTARIEIEKNWLDPFPIKGKEWIWCWCPTEKEAEGALIYANKTLNRMP